MKKYYLKILQKLCRYELKHICDAYPNSLDDLILWHDFMAIQSINSKTKAKDNLLGVCVQTAKELEKLIDKGSKILKR